MGVWRRCHLGLPRQPLRHPRQACLSKGLILRLHPVELPPKHASQFPPVVAVPTQSLRILSALRSNRSYRRSLWDAYPKPRQCPQAKNRSLYRIGPAVRIAVTGTGTIQLATPKCALCHAWIMLHHRFACCSSSRCSRTSMSRSSRDLPAFPTRAASRPASPGAASRSAAMALGRSWRSCSP